MILDRFRLTDRVAIVTGAGRGIGAATAVALAEAGADVVISARTEEQLEEVAARRRRRRPAGGRGARRPLRPRRRGRAGGGRPDGVRSPRHRRQQRRGQHAPAVQATAPRHLEQAFHFNVSTAHALTSAAAPLLLEGRAPDDPTGAVVNISSVMGRVSGRGYLAYGTAKAALSHYTRLAARDLAPRIRVNAIGVGSVATSALDVVLTDDDLRTAMEQTTPLRRIGDPDDIAATVLFLASDAGAYVTGQVLGADGGLDQPNLDLGIDDL